jgi:hypothetical protein
VEVEEGRRCRTYDYAGRAIVTIAVHEKMIQDEIRRVKSLAGSGGGGWVEDQCVDIELWEDDKLKKTKTIGVGDGTRGCILSGYGIGTRIGELRHMADVTRRIIVEDGKLNDTILITLQNNSNDAHVGTTPPKLDRKKAVNPYESRYGERSKDEVVEVQTSKKVKCITEMVTHIFKERERVMKGTQYEDELYFYDDALSQMTCHTTKEWMQRTGYIRYWILPLHGSTPVPYTLDVRPVTHLNSCLLTRRSSTTLTIA